MNQPSPTSPSEADGTWTARGRRHRIARQPAAHRHEALGDPPQGRGRRRRARRHHQPRGRVQALHAFGRRVSFLAAPRRQPWPARAARDASSGLSRHGPARGRSEAGTPGKTCRARGKICRSINQSFTRPSIGLVSGNRPRNRSQGSHRGERSGTVCSAISGLRVFPRWVSSLRHPSASSSFSPPASRRRPTACSTAISICTTAARSCRSSKP